MLARKDGRKASGICRMVEFYPKPREIATVNKSMAK
jgi:hypothetical protein